MVEDFVQSRDPVVTGSHAACFKNSFLKKTFVITDYGAVRLVKKSIEYKKNKTNEHRNIFGWHIILRISQQLTMSLIFGYRTIFHKISLSLSLFGISLFDI